MSLRRIVNQPRRGIGATSLDRLAGWGRASGLGLWEAIERVEEAPLGAAAAGRVAEFRAIIQELQIGAARARASATLLEKVLADVGYVAMLEAERTIESQGRLENLQELVGVAREYEDAWRGGAPAGRVPAGDLALLRHRTRWRTSAPRSR